MTGLLDFGKAVLAEIAKASSQPSQNGRSSFSYNVKPATSVPSKDNDPIRGWFYSVSQTNRDRLQPHELQYVLSFGPYGNFPLQTIRTIMASYDKQKTGEVDLSQFKEIVEFLNQFKSDFDEFDGNRDGYLTEIELRKALTEYGYSLSNTVLQSLLNR